MDFKRGIYRCAIGVTIVLLVLLQSFTDRIQEKLTSRIIMNRVQAAADALQTVSFDLKIQERVQGKYRVSSSAVKLQKSPRKIYMKLSSGPELLYIDGSNNDKVLVNPAGFPYVNLNLEINSSTLHKDQHHIIADVGFDYLTGIIKDAIARCGPKFEEYFKYEGDVKWNNLNCCKVVITDNTYKFSSYITGNDETVMSIARKLKLSEFKIAELNKLGDYGAVKAGKVLVIPSSYSRVTELLVDKQTWLPLSTKVYDNEGLFEAYDYMNLKLNPAFGPAEFTKSYKGYGF
jgi:outer membrane lipoprotein-sorting protein